jgi:Fe-S-cluster containining protein
MKSIDIKRINSLPGRRLQAGEVFTFHCHPQVPCFNRCCRNLNLFLYPYDVLRLKSALGIDSEAFLDQYVDVVLREGNYFPEVLLCMSDNADKTCPFLTPKGCSVYGDRPDTCRLYPVEQGAIFSDDGRIVQSIHLLRPADFCQGHLASQTLTVEAWVKDQDAERHNKMTLHWAEIKRLFQKNPWPAEGPQGPKAKMAFMAAYNIDRFRDFVFQSSFLRRYRVKPELKRKLRSKEEALLLFGFEWIKVFVWGRKSRQIRPR